MTRANQNRIAELESIIDQNENYLEAAGYYRALAANAFEDRLIVRKCIAANKAIEEARAELASL